jgi:hypothetical protein
MPDGGKVIRRPATTACRSRSPPRRARSARKSRSSPVDPRTQRLGGDRHLNQGKQTVFSKFKKPNAGASVPAAGTVRSGAPPPTCRLRHPRRSSASRSRLPPRNPRSPRPSTRRRSARSGWPRSSSSCTSAFSTTSTSPRSNGDRIRPRAEIVAISTEALEEMSVVLNKDDQQLNQELYRRGHGPRPAGAAAEGRHDQRHPGERPQQVFIERAGKLSSPTSTFKDEKHLLRIIDKIVSAVGRRVDESNPYVDARLATARRFNAMVPPMAVDGARLDPEVQEGQARGSTTSSASAPSPRRWRPICRPPCPPGST